MNLSEKALYHQIHPIKLLTDWSAAFLSLYFLWLHELLLGLALQVIPSVIVSLLIIRFVDLDSYRESRLGKYVGKYMTRRMQSLRAFGNIITIIGAWFQMFWIIGLGVGVIVLGWARGLVFP